MFADSNLNFKFAFYFNLINSQELAGLADEESAFLLKK